MIDETAHAAPKTEFRKPRLTFKALLIRFVVVWFLVGQMLVVCLPVATTKPLSRLESAYAARPSDTTKAALDNEFDRVAAFESQRAIGRFALLLVGDVVLVVLCWHVGNRHRRQENSAGVPSPMLAAGAS